jgi:hypothetical protein
MYVYAYIYIYIKDLQGNSSKFFPYDAVHKKKTSKTFFGPSLWTEVLQALKVATYCFFSVFLSKPTFGISAFSETQAPQAFQAHKNFTQYTKMTYDSVYQISYRQKNTPFCPPPWKPTLKTVKNDL